MLLAVMLQIRIRIRIRGIYFASWVRIRNYVITDPDPDTDPDPYYFSKI
jgi:hypothetical protein